MVLSVKEKSLVGIIDTLGNVLVPCKYKYVKSSSNGGYRVVRKNNKYGMLDKNYTEIIPVIYDEVQSFHNDLIGVKKEKWGLVDNTGQEVIAFHIDAIKPTTAGDRIRVYIEEHDFYLDKNGHCVKNCPNESILKKYNIRSIE